MDYVQKGQKGFRQPEKLFSLRGVMNEDEWMRTWKQMDECDDKQLLFVSFYVILIFTFNCCYSLLILRIV